MIISNQKNEFRQLSPASFDCEFLNFIFFVKDKNYCENLTLTYYKICNYLNRLLVETKC